jgi:EVE domain
MTGYWIGVAAANHIARGRDGGFMQLNHGKAAPLKRSKAGDIITYYSPVTVFGGTEKLRAFTAIGRVKEGEPYQGDMGGGFKPYRRDVEWFPAEFAPIEPLLDALAFTRGRKSWGYQFRFGFFAVSEGDMRTIAEAMNSAILK